MGIDNCFSQAMVEINTNESSRILLDEFTQAEMSFTVDNPH